MKYIKKFDSVSDMETALASSTISVLGMAMNGNTPVVRVREVTPTPPGPDYSTPFYIEDVSGSSNTLQIKKSSNNAPTLTIEKSTDGTTWETMGTTSTTAITATVPANGKLYLRCYTNNWGTASYYTFIKCTKTHKVGGNINSLLYGSSFNGQIELNSQTSYIFNKLFYNNNLLINSSDLLLPATTLVQYCYSSMFYGCTSLTTAPTLPATTLANSCYQQMFYGCTALTTAPELPATTLTMYCYTNMFSNCTALTTAPELPATTLANYCYNSMFSHCTALTSAPALPATTLTQNCYSSMFNGCTNLNYIKCLATDISASSCTNGWVYNIASTGTFVKNPSMSTSTWGTGNNGIPSGWTVEDATE